MHTFPLAINCAALILATFDGTVVQSLLKCSFFQAAKPRLIFKSHFDPCILSLASEWLSEWSSVALSTGKIIYLPASAFTKASRILTLQIQFWLPVWLTPAEKGFSTPFLAMSFPHTFSHHYLCHSTGESPWNDFDTFVSCRRLHISKLVVCTPAIAEGGFVFSHIPSWLICLHQCSWGWFSSWWYMELERLERLQVLWRSGSYVVVWFSGHLEKRNSSNTLKVNSYDLHFVVIWESPFDGFDLGTTTELTFRSPKFQQYPCGISLRPLKCARNKPVGDTKHRAYAGFRLFADSLVWLRHCCEPSGSMSYAQQCSHKFQQALESKMQSQTWFTGLELYLVSNNINSRTLLWFIYWSY